ncbi:hypothetical protein ANCCAN_10122 [Ancylostoma caninum]|uniref:Carboxylesterase type B domain-containing protein n=1 Tax=Ancylostoma caninum TaxID=29170 RepID=A0A368GHR7_ANCCA|nr:hypothetical protein ANCCAN_10122 [Ancylostoma caninum]
MDFHRYDKYSAENMKRQSEDCLYLNVFSPYDHEDESKTFPIIVWIHGGSFLAGSADTGIDMETIARNIIFKGITFVTINYRLGPLGTTLPQCTPQIFNPDAVQYWHCS